MIKKQSSWQKNGYRHQINACFAPSPYPILLRITREFDQNNIDRGWEVAYFFLFSEKVLWRKS